MSLDMYAEEILDHYRSPRNFGRIENPDASFRDLNPLCGDQYEFHLKFSGDKISDVKFSGDGCAISMASASMLSELVKGKKKSDVGKIKESDLVKMLGVDISPVRMKCAMLPLSILKRCVSRKSNV